MSYGTPTPNENLALYSASLTYTNGVLVTISVQADPFGQTASLCDPAFQAALDLLSGDADFDLSVPGGKQYPTTEDVTPTP